MSREVLDDSAWLQVVGASLTGAAACAADHLSGRDVNPLEIDIYSDVVCPWCFIGTRRLESVLASFGDSLDVTVRHHPYLLHPDASPEGIDLRAMLARKYGMDPARMFDRVEAAARDAGIPLDFSTQTRTYSTVAAHTLLRHAEEKGTQRALADALFAAYFLEGRNVDDPGVLADVAAGYGFSEPEVRALVADDAEAARTHQEARDASERGIRGVPLFVINGREAISGAQPAAVFRRAIAQVVEPARAARTAP